MTAMPCTVCGTIHTGPRLKYCGDECCRKARADMERNRRRAKRNSDQTPRNPNDAAETAEAKAPERRIAPRKVPDRKEDISVVRRRLARDVKAFLANGGRITKIPIGVTAVDYAKTKKLGISRSAGT